MQKWTLTANPIQTIEVPASFEFVTLQLWSEHKVPAIWGSINSGDDVCFARSVKITRGEGEVPDKCSYIGTVVLNETFHVFLQDV